MSQLTGPAYKHEDYAGFIRRTAALYAVTPWNGG